MRNFLINLLFKLLGNTHQKQFSIVRLFGAEDGDTSHERRKRAWERALVRLWHDKDMLDYLYYQAESDKERAWSGKIDKRLSQGARVRTLFLVQSAHRAFLESKKGKGDHPDKVASVNKEIEDLNNDYKKVTDIKEKGREA